MPEGPEIGGGPVLSKTPDFGFGGPVIGGGPVRDGGPVRGGGPGISGPVVDPGVGVFAIRGPEIGGPEIGGPEIGGPESCGPDIGGPGIFEGCILALCSSGFMAVLVGGIVLDIF